MRLKWTLLVLLLTLGRFADAQAAEDSLLKTQQIKNLFVLSKVWGFLKYYHPQVAAGKFNWDQELLQEIPVMLKAGSDRERSDSLLAWVNRLGDVPPCAGCNDSLLKKARLVPDFSWFDRSGFSPAFAGKLKYIRQNRFQGDLYYLETEREPAFDYYVAGARHETPFYKISFPDDWFGLLALFRFWNYIEYWYPYKYGLARNWNQILLDFIPRMHREISMTAYLRDVHELVAALHDSHGFIESFRLPELLGKYNLPFTVKYMKGTLIITGIIRDSLAERADIRKGDIIYALNGKPVDQLVQELQPLIPASTLQSLYNKLSYFITRTPEPQTQLLIQRIDRKRFVTCGNFIPKPGVFINQTPPYFPFEKDTVWASLPGRILYLNMALLNRNDSADFKARIMQSRGLIIDLRNNLEEGNGTNALIEIIRMLTRSKDPVFQFSTLQPSYPGVFRFTVPINYNQSGADFVYKGKTAVLINENTMSIGEFAAMNCQRAYDVKLFGTPTAGSDGTVTQMLLPGAVGISFTTIGMYYPGGKETQRMGIVPDRLVPQTRKGYIEQQDEQLDAAIQYLRQSLSK